MLEIEIKAYCDNLEDAVKKAVSLGAKLHDERVETDEYFGHPARDFGKTDEALRMRSVSGRTILTYKGPKIGTETKTREEIETEISDPVSMKNILLNLGFVFTSDVVKHRTVYLLDGVEICADRVQGVGDFVELEIKSDDRENGERKLFAMAGKLGLSRFERRSYLEMKMCNLNIRSPLFSP